MNMIKKLFLSKTGADGFHVVGRRLPSGAIVLQRIDGSKSQTRVVPPNEEVRCEAIFDGVRSKIEIWIGRERNAYMFDEVFYPSEQECRAAHAKLLKDLSWRPSTWKPIAWGVVAGLALLVISSPSTPGNIPAVAETQFAPVPMSAPPSVSPEPNTQLLAGELAEVGEAMKSGLKLTSTGKQFAVFSDPNCPYCQELEGSLSKLDSSISPVVLPLGYKDGSREISSAVMCSKDPVKAWKDYMVNGKKPEAAACDAGYKQVEANMALFQKLKLGSTPTMITPTGTIVTGSGSAEAILAVMTK